MTRHDPWVSSVTSESITVYSGNGYRYVTNIAPGKSFTVSTYMGWVSGVIFTVLPALLIRAKDAVSRPREHSEIAAYFQVPLPVGKATENETENDRFWLE